MKKMSIIFMMSLCLISALSLTGCGKKGGAVDSSAEVSVSEDALEESETEAADNTVVSDASSLDSETDSAEESDAVLTPEEVSEAEEVIDYPTQIKIITDNKDKWTSGSLGAYTACAVTDLDNNKRLEVVAVLDSDGKTYASIWEVNDDISGLVCCTQNIPESSFPNLAETPQPITVYKGNDGLNHYYLETVEPGAGSNIYHNVMPITLSHQNVTVDFIGIRAEENGRVIYRSLDGFEYSEDEFYHKLTESQYGSGTYDTYTFNWESIGDNLYERLIAQF